MKLGLLSDTHGKVELVEKTIQQFKEHQPDVLIHTGDITRVSDINSLFELDIPLHIVFGNCDFNTESFKQAERSTSMVLHGSADLLSINGTKIGITHGHFDRLFDELRQEDPDIIIHGHTHERRDEKQGNVRYINPGSVKPPNSSIAILQPSDEKLQFIDL